MIDRDSLQKISDYIVPIRNRALDDDAAPAYLCDALLYLEELIRLEAGHNVIVTGPHNRVGPNPEFDPRVVRQELTA